MRIIQLAGCAIVDDLDRIFLLHRVKTDWYELPGGKYDSNHDSNLEDTARREFLEELLCNVKIERKLGDTTFQEDGDTLIYHWFYATLLGKPEIGEDKFDRFEYLPLKDLDKYRLSPNMMHFYQGWLAGKICIKSK